MRARTFTRPIIAVIIALLLLFNSVRVAAQESYSESSWALGIVVPEGAELAGGYKLQWDNVTNITAVMVLPNISKPDNIVYAVLSVMTENGSVLQVAAGIFPNASTWSVYSWLFTDLASNPVRYEWVLNSSEPEMAPGDKVSISIFKSLADVWSLSVVDIDTGSAVQDSFPSNLAVSLQAGNQEVFALESYSRNASTFQDMGNLTLTSLLIDGRSLSGGFYTYDGSWNPTHNPLFVIGTEGTIPPIFISFEEGSNSMAVWSYTGGWTSNGLAYPSWIEMVLMLVLLLVSIITIAFVFRVTKRNNRNRML